MENLIRVFIISFALGLSACQETNSMTDTTVPEEPKMNHSVDGLDKWILLPAQPDSVKWSISQTVPGSRDSGLTVLLHYGPEDYEKIVKNSEKHNVVTDAIVDREAFEEWAPEEVKAEFEVESFSEYSVILVGRPALQPNLFVDLDGSSPYRHGYVYPIGKGYIIVSLSTM